MDKLCTICGAPVERKHALAEKCNKCCFSGRYRGELPNSSGVPKKCPWCGNPELTTRAAQEFNNLYKDGKLIERFRAPLTTHLDCSNCGVIATKIKGKYDVEDNRSVKQ